MDIDAMLDAAKKAQGIETDMALATALGVKRAAVSGWRHGNRLPDPVACAALAGLTGIPLARVLGIVGEARAISREEKSVWRKLAASAATVLLVVVATLPAATPAHASGMIAQAATEAFQTSGICIMRSHCEYVSVVVDLYSRLVVGWSMSERMTSTLVCDALQMALFRRQRPRGVIVHSDRGSQYCSKEHRKLLADNGLLCSMSAKGNCYDNAAMESWNHSLKVEAIHGEKLPTRKYAKAHVFDSHGRCVAHQFTCQVLRRINAGPAKRGIRSDWPLCLAGSSGLQRFAELATPCRAGVALSTKSEQSDWHSHLHQIWCNNYM